MIVKPSLSEVGKSGITYVKSESHLDKAINNALNCSLNNHVLLEEYLNGDDYVLYGLIKEGNLTNLSILKEINNISKEDLIYGSGIRTISESETREVLKQIKTISSKLISALKIIHTP